MREIEGMHPRTRNWLASRTGMAIGIGVTVFTLASSVTCAADRSDDAAPGEPATAYTVQDHSVVKADRRAQSLRRGMNVSHWFAQVKDPRGSLEALLAGGERVTAGWGGAFDRRWSGR